MTLVHADLQGDAWFPDFPLYEWHEVESHDHAADDNNPYYNSFVILEKKVERKSEVPSVER